MCGFFACLLKRRLTAADIAAGRRAAAALAHRGPDAAGEWYDEAAGVYMGHRRLSILDLSDAADQPMVRDGRVLAYNGEIYNFRQLRRDIEAKGHVLQSSGDSEVLLRALQIWGSEAFDRLDGMFAFVLWDGTTATLAVDPFAEKPLYWAETPEGVYVASELAPLADLLGAAPDLTGDKLLDLLALGYIDVPKTAWRGIERLPGGQVLTVRKGAVASRKHYWRIPLGEPGRGRVAPLSEADLDRVAETLTGSLADRLVADVPLCLFLSAGIDSSLVAALLSRELGQKALCVTVAFPDSSVADEAPLAARTADHLGLAHKIIEGDADSANATVERVLALFGQPNDNLTVLAIEQMTRAASGAFKVGLSGMGGDEIFLGYGKHALFYGNRHWHRLPQGPRRAVGRLGHMFLGQSARHLAKTAVSDSQIYLAQKNAEALPWLRQLPGFEDWARRSFAGKGAPAYMAAAAYELEQHMASSQLAAFDLGSMRASFELRTPFLSRALAETMACFDPRSLMAFGQKSVLRRLAARYLPAALVDQPKRGFVLPPARLLEGRANRPPRVAAVPADLAQEAWRRRGDSRRWSRLAVRLALAESFNGMTAADLMAGDSSVGYRTGGPYGAVGSDHPQASVS